MQAATRDPGPRATQRIDLAPDLISDLTFLSCGAAAGAEGEREARKERGIQLLATEKDVQVQCTRTMPGQSRAAEHACKCRAHLGRLVPTTTTRQCECYTLRGTGSTPLCD